MNQLMSVDWAQVLGHLLTLAAAYVLALPIAWDREQKERTAGLRTFPLVAMAACSYMLIGFALLPDPNDHGRVVQGLLTGIGFIGGGAILKRGDGVVQGTATAASLWTTGAIGLAAAAQRLEIAIVISLATYATLRFLKPLKKEAQEQQEADQEADGETDS